VLDGFGDMLSHTGIIQFEFGINSLVLARRPLRDFWCRLEGLGFRIGKLMPRCIDFAPYRPRYEARWANIVAVRNAPTLHGPATG